MRTRRTRPFLFVLCAVVVLVGAISLVNLVSGSSVPPAQAACGAPSDVMDLTGWKVTLPTGADEPDEIEQPELTGFSADPWFVPTEDCSGIRFRSAVNGVTTANSKNPRSELREMIEDGSNEAEWSTSAGTSTMTVRGMVTHLPAEKPHVVAAQVHGGSDDLTAFRLEGSSFWVTNGDETHHQLITDSYELGTPYELKFVAGGGQIEAYFDGQLVTTIPADSSTAYFKTGAYTQAHCENSSPCDETNYGETVLCAVDVTHEGTAAGPTDDEERARSESGDDSSDDSSSSSDSEASDDSSEASSDDSSSSSDSESSDESEASDGSDSEASASDDDGEGPSSASEASAGGDGSSSASASSSSGEEESESSGWSSFQSQEDETGDDDSSSSSDSGESEASDGSDDDSSSPSDSEEGETGDDSDSSSSAGGEESGDDSGSSSEGEESEAGESGGDDGGSSSEGEESEAGESSGDDSGASTTSTTSTGSGGGDASGSCGGGGSQDQSPDCTTSTTASDPEETTTTSTTQPPPDDEDSSDDDEDADDEQPEDDESDDSGSGDDGDSDDDVDADSDYDRPTAPSSGPLPGNPDLTGFAGLPDYPDQDSDSEDSAGEASDEEAEGSDSSGEDSAGEESGGEETAGEESGGEGSESGGSEEDSSSESEAGESSTDADSETTGSEQGSDDAGGTDEAGEGEADSGDGGTGSSGDSADDPPGCPGSEDTTTTEPEPAEPDDTTTTTASSSPAPVGGPGRIAYQADGNAHDPDDHASAGMVLAILAAEGLQQNLVNYTYNNHISEWGETDSGMVATMTESVMGSAERFGFDSSLFFDASTDQGLADGVADLTAEINASTADNPLTIALAGPMETVWMALDAADPEARTHVRCVSHGDGSHNQTHGGEHGGHTYDDVIELGCQRVQIPDQNGNLGPTDMGDWGYLNESGDPNLAWLYERLEAAGGVGDVSDAGMIYFAITDNEEPTRDDFRSVLTGGGADPSASSGSEGESGGGSGGESASESSEGSGGSEGSDDSEGSDSSESSDNSEGDG